KHFVRGHDFQELRIVAEFHMIVRCRRSGGDELEPDALECFDQGARRLAGEAFQDRCFIQRYDAEFGRVEPVEPVIIANVYARSCLRLVTDDTGLIAPLIGPALRLTGDGKGCEYEGAIVGGLDCLLAELKLHLRFAQPGVEEASDSNGVEMRLHAMGLEREQMRCERVDLFQPALWRSHGLPRKE